MKYGVVRKALMHRSGNKCCLACCLDFTEIGRTLKLVKNIIFALRKFCWDAEWPTNSLGPHLDVLAGQQRLPEELVAAARLVIVQAHGQRGVLRDALEARRALAGEVRLEAVLGGYLVDGLPGHCQLHQRVGQLVGLERHHHPYAQPKGLSQTGT